MIDILIDVAGLLIVFLVVFGIVGACLYFGGD